MKAGWRIDGNVFSVLGGKGGGGRKGSGLVVKVARVLEFVDPAELFVGPSIDFCCVFWASPRSLIFIYRNRS